MALKGVRPDWWPNWQSQCVAVVGSGPSLRREQVDALKERIHVVAVNNSYELCPWADALYSCDAKWWKYKDGAKDFDGLKMAYADEAVKLYPDIKKINISKMTNNDATKELQMVEYNTVGGGGNSGFQVVNWLAQVGVSAIALLGFDMRVDGNGKAHWHGRHPDSGAHVLNNPYDEMMAFWVKHMTNAAPKLSRLDIDVVNCSDKTALTCFPKMSVEDALARWGL